MAHKVWGSTGKMLVDMTIAFCGAPKDTPPNDPELVKGIQLNATVGKMKRSISALESDRTSVFSMQSQVTDLIPNVEANTLLKPDAKSQLKTRIGNLMELIKQGVAIDATLSLLDAKASELKSKLFESLKSYFSKKPSEPAQTSAERTAIATEIEERAKETDRTTRSFQGTFRTLSGAYVQTRESLPGTLNLKSINTLTAPKTDTETQPARLEK